MADRFASHTTSLDSPAANAAEIDTSSGGLLDQPTRAIYVGQGGDLRVRMVSGDIVNLVGVLGGAIYPLRIDRFYPAGTTADAIVALY